MVSAFSLMEQVLTELVPTVSQHESEHLGVMSLPRYLPHRELWFDQHRTERKVLLAIELAVVDWYAEESSEPNRVILALRF